MLEQFVSNLLSDLAEQYLEDFDSKQLKISLLKGNLEITNLSLKPDLFRDLHQSLVIVHSHIGSVNISLSLAKIRTKPVAVEVRDIAVLLSADSYLPTRKQVEQKLKDAFLNKLEAIMSYQMLFEERIQEKLEGKKKETKVSSYIKNLVQEVIKNIKINIHNIHFRFEDIDNNICLGATILKVSVQDQEKLKGPETDCIIAKRCEVSGFSVYCNNHFEHLSQQGCKKQEVIRFLLKNDLFNAETIHEIFQFIIQPVFVLFGLQYNMQVPTKLSNDPKIKISFLMDDLNINLSTFQLNTILHEVVNLNSVSRCLNKLEERPIVSFSGHQLEWYQYAFINHISEPYFNQENVAMRFGEVANYCKYFAQHYINTKISQNRVDTQFSNQMASKNESLQCNSAKSNIIVNHYHQQFNVHQLAFCRYIVISSLAGKNIATLKKQNFQFILEADQCQNFLTEFFAMEIEEIPDGTLFLQLSVDLNVVSIKLNSVQTISLSNSQSTRSVSQSLVQLITKNVSFNIQTTTPKVVCMHMSLKELMLINCIATDYKVLYRNTPLSDDHTSQKISNQLFDSLQNSDFLSENSNNYIDIHIQIPEEGGIAQFNLNMEPSIIVITPSLLRLMYTLFSEFSDIWKQQTNYQLIINFIYQSHIIYNNFVQYSKEHISRMIETRKQLQVLGIFNAPTILIPKEENLLLINFGTLIIQNHQPNSLEDYYDHYLINLNNVCAFVLEKIYVVDVLNMINNYVKEDLDLVNSCVILKRSEINISVNVSFLKNNINTDQYQFFINISEIHCIADFQRIIMLFKIICSLINEFQSFKQQLGVKIYEYIIQITSNVRMKLTKLLINPLSQTSLDTLKEQKQQLTECNKLRIQFCLELFQFNLCDTQLSLQIELENFKIVFIKSQYDVSIILCVSKFYLRDNNHNLDIISSQNEAELLQLSLSQNINNSKTEILCKTSKISFICDPKMIYDMSKYYKKLFNLLQPLFQKDDDSQQKSFTAHSASQHYDELQQLFMQYVTQLSNIDICFVIIADELKLSLINLCQIDQLNKPSIEFNIFKIDLQSNMKIIPKAPVQLSINIMVQFDANNFQRNSGLHQQILQDNNLQFQYNSKLSSFKEQILTSEITMRTESGVQFNLTPDLLFRCKSIFDRYNSIQSQDDQHLVRPLLYQLVNEKSQQIDNHQQICQHNFIDNLTNKFIKIHSGKQTVEINKFSSKHCELIISSSVDIEFSEESIKFKSINLSVCGYQLLQLLQGSIVLEIQRAKQECKLIFRTNAQVTNETDKILCIDYQNTCTTIGINKSFQFSDFNEQSFTLKLNENGKGTTICVPKINNPVEIEGFNFIISKTITVLDQQEILSINIRPTFRVRNENIHPLLLDEVIVNPGCYLKCYKNVQEDLVFNQIRSQDFVSCSQVIIAQSKCYQGQITQFLLKNQFKTERFGIRCCSTTDFAIYPLVVIRNLVATHTHSPEYGKCTLAVVTTSGVDQVCLGETILAQSDYNDSFNYQLTVGEHTFKSVKSLSLKTAKSTIICGDSQIQFVLDVGLAVNNMTKVISILPAFVVRNKINTQINVAFGSKESKQCNYFTKQLEPDEESSILGQHAFAFIYKGLWQNIPSRSSSSSAIPLNELNTYQFQTTFGSFTAHVYSDNGIKFLDFYSTVKTPIYVENLLDQNIEVSQETNLAGAKFGAEIDIEPSITVQQSIIVDQNTKKGYLIWDVSIPFYLKIKVKEGAFCLNMQTLGQRDPQVRSGRQFFFQLNVRQGARVLSVSEKPFSLNKIATDLQYKLESDNWKQRISIAIPYFQISLFSFGTHNILSGGQVKAVKGIPVEILAVSIKQLNFTAVKFEYTSFYSASLKSIIVYNMDPEAQYKTVLNMITENNKDVLMLEAEKLNDGYQYSSINLVSSEFSVNVDQTLIDLCMDYVAEISPSFLYCDDISYDPLTEMELIVAQHILPKVPQSPKIQPDFYLFYIDYLSISNINASITININSLPLTVGFATSLVNTIGTTFMKLKNAQICLSNYERAQIFCPVNQFIEQTRRFYIAEASKNIGSVLQSSLLFGFADVALHIGSGIKDIQRARNAQQRLNGFGNLLKHSIGGVLSLSSGTTDSVSRVANSLGFDSEETAKRSKRLRQSQNDGAKSVQNAALGAGLGLLQGLTGVFIKPIKGAQAGGAAGFFKGLGQGIMDIPVRPLVGVVDAVTHLTAGAEGAMFREPQIFRPQRVYVGGVILPLIQDQTKKNDKPVDK